MSQSGQDGAPDAPAGQSGIATSIQPSTTRTG